MRYFLTISCIVTLVMLPMLAGSAEKAAPLDLKTDAQKLSYALGMEIGGSLKRLDTELDLKAFMQAVEDVIKDNQPILSAPDAAQIKQAFFKTFQEKQTKLQQEAGEKAKVESEKFLAANKAKKDVKTTASGLQYQVVKEGKGEKPKVDDKVTVHYKGMLLDGKVFDSSIDRGEPVTFPVNGVIPGWTEALQLMPVGSTYKLFIPSNLAYGERGAGQDIPPHAALVFEVELLSIEKK